MSDCVIFFTIKYSINNEECLWEYVPATAKGAFYRLDKPPLFMTGVAVGDVVLGRSDRKIHGAHLFLQVVRPSGHSTIHLTLTDRTIAKHIGKNLGLGEYKTAFTETKKKGVYRVSIDVPPRTLYHETLKVKLAEGQQLGLWSFQEACMAHTF